MTGDLMHSRSVPSGSLTACVDERDVSMDPPALDGASNRKCRVSNDAGFHVFDRIA